MKELNFIDGYVQNIAEVIASVLGVDVTIVDNKSIRIAGSGKYKSKIGEKVVSNSVFSKAMNTKKSYIVNMPRVEEVCFDCDNKEYCIEYAEVCCPIVVKEDVIGVIGLVAFTKSQKKELVKNEKNLLLYLSKMSDLIAAKLIEAEVMENEKIMRKQIEAIIESMDDGVIAVDESNRIIYHNGRAEEILKTSDIDNIICDFLKDEAFKFTKSIRNAHRVINNTNVILNIKSVEIEGRFIGAVLILKSLKSVNRMINDITVPDINTSFEDILGNSKELTHAKELGKIASLSDSTVIISGESGTGKELFARAIHSSSIRKNKPFIAVNCAAIPEGLLESELFGYVEGSFTGAKKGGKIGKFELANGGTIFLDEIGDMPLHMQTKLLRVLQEREIEKVGSEINTPVNIRIIAATHKDLYNMVATGEFRSDLFYRLNVIPIIIPPLRERKDDIELLLRSILRKCNIKVGKDIKLFSEAAREIIISYSWPGNVRELENIIEYAVNVEKTEVICTGSIPDRIKKVNETNNELNLCNLEKKAIQTALLNYSKDEAAEVLGIGRATLYRKIKEYKIKVSK